MSELRNFRALVVGAGSIGRRHADNMQRLGVNQITFVEPNLASRQSLGFPSVSALEEAWQVRPDFAVIATPTSLHAEPALACLNRKIPVFIEKPLCTSWTEAKLLIRAARQVENKTLIGCNMRFHPGPQKVRELLRAGVIGSVYFARISAGSYLPEWRPGSDYRTQYSARREMGGGCVLDYIHEIDLASWYLGPVAEVFCASGHLSNLEINTEDVAMLILKHRAGSLSQVELDYVQRRYDRGCHIVGEKGNINWDFNRHSVTHYDALTGQTHVFTEPQNYSLNQMYLDEMAHFLEVIRGEATSVLPIDQAAMVLEIALGAQKSSESKQMIALTGISL